MVKIITRIVLIAVIIYVILALRFFYRMQQSNKVR